MDKEIEVAYIEDEDGGGGKVTLYRVMHHVAKGNYQGTSIRMNKETALALANAIYDELGLGWLPYPDNTPSDKDWEKKFEVTRVSTDGHAFVDISVWYEKSDWMGRGRRVTAFRPLPKPYQENEGR